MTTSYMGKNFDNIKSELKVKMSTNIKVNMLFINVTDVTLASFSLGYILFKNLKQNSLWIREEKKKKRKNLWSKPMKISQKDVISR